MVCLFLSITFISFFLNVILFFVLVSFIWMNEWMPAFHNDQYDRFDKIHENRMEIITSSIHVLIKREKLF